MASIDCISKTLVHASNPIQDAAQRVELTPWELQFLLLGPIQKGLLFYKPNLHTSIIDRLKTSFSRTLDFFPPLSGRLATVVYEDDTASFYVDCNNHGALFVHAVADGVSVSDIVEPTYVPDIVHSLFPQNDRACLLLTLSTSEPILAVQVTELVDGIFIGCTISHSVCDGTSFWHFFNSWAEISRGSVTISKSPLFHRWLPDGIEFPIRIPNSMIKQIHTQFVPPSFQEKIFHFTKENIAKLKAKANAEVGTERISSLQALFSCLLRSIFRMKQLDPNTEVCYTLLISCRSRFQSLPEEYFGSAVQLGSLTMKAKELAEQGMGSTAWEMNRMVAAHTEEKLRELLESWTKRPKLLTLSGVLGNALATSSSPRFNVYGNDFGWGKPIAVRSGEANKSDGKITVFCGVEEGSIDIQACLSPETFETLSKDEDIMAAQTI